MIELLVVITIIGILLAAVLVAGSSILTSAKARNTRAVLQVIDSALETFRNEKPSILSAKQTAATGGGLVKYTTRYGSYPPDETELFTPAGLPGSGPPPASRSLAIGKREFAPAPVGGTGYPPFKYYIRGNDKSEYEHRDMIAMVLAIDMFCEPAAMILSKIPDSNRSPGLLDPSGNPLQFMELTAGGLTPDGAWQVNSDEQIPNVFLDSWGMPLAYFSQRDFTGNTGDIVSSNDPNWNQASTEMIRLNRQKPIIMSWGPDGKDQLTEEAQQDPTASLVGDWANNQKIDNLFNEDNVYLDEAFNKTLAEGSAPTP